MLTMENIKHKKAKNKENLEIFRSPSRNTRKREILSGFHVKQFDANLEFLRVQVGASKRFIAKKLKVETGTVWYWRKKYVPKYRLLEICAVFNELIPGLELTPEQLQNTKLEEIYSEIDSKHRIYPRELENIMALAQPTRIQDSDPFMEFVGNENLRILLKTTPEELTILRAHHWEPEYRPSEMDFMSLLLTIRKR